jgi:hypothetical protein
MKVRLWMRVDVFAHTHTSVITSVRLILGDKIVCIAMASENLTVTGHL